MDSLRAWLLTDNEDFVSESRRSLRITSELYDDQVLNLLYRKGRYLGAIVVLQSQVTKYVQLKRKDKNV